MYTRLVSNPKTLQDTLPETRADGDDDGPAIPGVVLVFSHGRPACSVFSGVDNVVALGRDDDPDGALADRRMSRRHAEVRFGGDAVRVIDLESRNGTFVDGERVGQATLDSNTHVLRTGNSLFLICRDIRPFQSASVQQLDGVVMGPSLLAAWRLIGRHARSSETLFLHGESGVGKERAARTYHRVSARSGSPLVAVNCGAIPGGMTERLFFGTKRGAFSGAVADAQGYVQAAHGGVLFLDEVAELDLAIQAKLLRVLESKEVLPLGAVRATAVDFAICAATHRDLRAEVAQGRFRQDLYFRMGRPEVRLPPLRERREEIPFLIEYALRGAATRDRQREPSPADFDGDDRSGEAVLAAETASLKVHASFVESCLIRQWPGNVRELLLETRAAAHEALAHGSEWLKDNHLEARAGVGFAGVVGIERGRRDDNSDGDSDAHSRPDRDLIVSELRANRGNISGTARALRVHRTQLRRWIEHYEIDVTALRPRS